MVTYLKNNASCALQLEVNLQQCVINSGWEVMQPCIIFVSLGVKDSLTSQMQTARSSPKSQRPSSLLVMAILWV